MKTQSHNFKSVPYQGSKAKLLTFLEESLDHYLSNFSDNQEINSFFDAFSGSGQVAHHFKDKFDLITNDKQSFTKVINDTFLSSNAHVERIQELVDELNNLPELYFYQTDGWFTETYSQDFLDGSAVSLDGSRKLWLSKNARKIDMIRTRIDEMRENGEINQDEMNILLTSLLRASNLVQNTLGHQNSYLKEWSDKSLKDLVLLVPEFEQSKRKHKNLCGDIGDVIDEVHADITYFDPPYGSNNKSGSGFSYSAYYHLNNTIVDNNRPETFGKANRPIATKANKDTIEKNKKELVMPEFINLVQRSKSKFVCFSYSTQGLLSAQDFEEVFRLGGCEMATFKVYYTSHKKNKQSQTALKNGDSINRDNHDEELYELFIIAQKKPVRLVDNNLEHKIETYLEKSVSTHSINDKSYSIYYDNTEGSFIEKTKGDISMTSETLKLNPQMPDSVSYVKVVGNFDKPINLKWIYVQTPDHFVEVMHYTRRLLNQRFYDEIDSLCVNAKGDIQGLYNELGIFIETQIDIHIDKNLVIDECFALSYDINDETSPVNSGMMLFVEEHYIYPRVLDYVS
ncbi:DNA adenine methylase [Vibrio sp. Vb1980]|uniref:DNA adenine methylase n=1 Tax=Vibrio sp. Vb1980 TaxID=3074646 RepID=UPI002963C9CE|nr:DNA adenine methylase [Vibrio sp. Vb1980]MDW1975675.1 DNA adenine methylase [Vibrio sp. Vb1980]